VTDTGNPKERDKDKSKKDMGRSKTGGNTQLTLDFRSTIEGEGEKGQPEHTIGTQKRPTDQTEILKMFGGRGEKLRGTICKTTSKMLTRGRKKKKGQEKIEKVDDPADGIRRRKLGMQSGRSGMWAHSSERKSEIY